MLALFFGVGVILYLTLRVVQYLRSGYTDYVHVFLFYIFNGLTQLFEE